MNDRQITLRLVTRSGLHVGAGSGDSVTDALVRRDASGRPIIPGTSFAGSLRALATRLAPRLGFAICAALKGDSSGSAARNPCGCEVCSLFGDIDPVDEQGRASGEEAGAAGERRRARAGRLWVHDARPLGEARGWVRDGVGIERETGAAYRRGRTKFDVETLPPCVEFDLRLEVQAPDGRVDIDREERLLAAVLSEWVAGRGTVGGRTSRGLGALAVKDGSVTYRKLDLADAANLFDYIAGDDPWRAQGGDGGWLQRRIAEIRQRPFAPVAEGAAQAWAELVAEIQFAGPMLVNDPALAAISGFDHAPFSASGDLGAPAIPGSSLKGVLRSCAERIARTLSTRAVWRDAEPARRGEEFLARCPACDPLVGRLEGAVEASGRGASRENPGSLGATATTAMTSCDALLSGVVATTDEVADRHLCLACRLFGSPRRGSRLRVEDASLVGEPRCKAQDFLAIDRFTGGGADKRKFDALVLWRPRFRARFFLENPAVWELGWLLLSLREVADGLASIGFGAAKGFGLVESADWTARIGFLDPAAFPAEAPPGPWVPDGLYTTVACTRADQMAWRTLAAGWVETFVGAVRDFRRAESGAGLPHLMADSYFGNGRNQLYPVEALDGSLG